ncbi:hypothetical protein [Synechococcus phage BUCT-ZZ01]|nr:hypothetical protein [Synechococcus phage BUCT-ZZ01]
MGYRSVHEILTEANESNNPVETLQKNGSEFLKALLHLSYAEWDGLELPIGPPPYNPLPGSPDIAPNKLLNNKMLQYLGYFKNENFTQGKRETLFIQYLEGLSAEEAQVLIDAKDKVLNQKYKNLTREVIDTAFPELLVLKDGQNVA